MKEIGCRVCFALFATADEIRSFPQCSEKFHGLRNNSVSYD